MRTLIALIACCLVLPTASANDPPKPASHDAPAAKPAEHSASAEAAKPAAPSAAEPKSMSASAESAKPNAKAAAATAAAQRKSEDDAEAELSVKIAARLAAMRANQAARAAAAEKQRRANAAKKTEAVTVAAMPAHGSHWSYEGELGPANWGKINVDWAKCSTGNRQSPIDIRDGMKVDLEQIVFDYKPSTFNVTDNGHTIQVNLSGGNYITLQNRMYELLQFHFHRPSEERINGRGFEMVVHLVHRDAEGKLAVVALMLERGKSHPLIQTVWNNLPLEKNDTVQPTIVLDVSEFLPHRRDYYTFMGSLTTPPCSEGVLWLVMKEPVQASPAQMALFSRLYPLNARPIQAAAGRVIKESN